MIEIVKFGASWCWPCKMVHPVLEEISKEKDYRYSEIDIEEEWELTQAKWITTVPTIVINRDGIEIGRIVWAKPKEEIIDIIDSLNIIE